MIDDRTPNLSLPLPHRDNDLTVDVERLRQALNTIDDLLGSLLNPVPPPQQGGDGEAVE